MRLTVQTLTPPGETAPAPADGHAQNPGQTPAPALDTRPGGVLVKVDGTPRLAPADTANTRVQRDAKGRLLPGQSLNPGGRKAGLKAIIDEVVDFRAIIDMLNSIAVGKLAPAAQMRDRMKAAELLLSYKFGKPQQTIEMNEGKGTAAQQVKTMTTEKLLALRETLRGSLTDVTDAEIVEP